MVRLMIPNDAPSTWLDLFGCAPIRAYSYFHDKRHTEFLHRVPGVFHHAFDHFSCLFDLVVWYFEYQLIMHLYVCMYLCMYVCMYACMHSSFVALISSFGTSNTNSSCTYMYVCMYVLIYTHACMYICIYIYIYIYIYAYV